mgnify:FL=1
MSAVLVIAFFWLYVWLDWWVWRETTTEPPEQRHDVLTGDDGDECMEGSFREW